MTTISRPSKTDGGTSYTVGGTIYAADVNGDIDTIYNDHNGNLTDVNVKAAADIDPSKIGDYSANAAEAITVTSPGTTDSPSLATTLEGEIARLRHLALYAGLGSSALYHNGSANAAVGPYDGVRVGHNLIQNGSVQIQTGGAGTAPDGWTLSNSPSAVALAASAASEGDAQHLAITGAGAADGITQTIEGIKADTLYIIGCRARAAVNAGTISVTGGNGSGAFQNTSTAIAVHASQMSTYSLAVKSDASGSDMTVTVATGTTSGDQIFVHDFFMFEVSKNPVSAGTTTLVKKSLTSAVDITTSGVGNQWETGPSGLDASITPFKNNQRVIYHATLCIGIFNNIFDESYTNAYVRLLRDGTGVGTYGFEFRQDSSNGSGVPGTSTISIVDVVDNPEPGTSVDYTLEVWDSSAIDTLIYRFSPDTTWSPQTTCDVVLRLEDIH